MLLRDGNNHHQVFSRNPEVEKISKRSANSAMDMKERIIEATSIFRSLLILTFLVLLTSACDPDTGQDDQTNQAPEIELTSPGNDAESQLPIFSLWAPFQTTRMASV